MVAYATGPWHFARCEGKSGKEEEDLIPVTAKIPILPSWASFMVLWVGALRILLTLLTSVSVLNPSSNLVGFHFHGLPNVCHLCERN